MNKIEPKNLFLSNEFHHGQVHPNMENFKKANIFSNRKFYDSHSVRKKDPEIKGEGRVLQMVLDLSGTTQTALSAIAIIKPDKSIDDKLTWIITTEHETRLI